MAIAVNCSVSSAFAAMTDKPLHCRFIGSVWLESRQAPPARRGSRNGFTAVKKILQDV